ncbi:MAG: hypothetical protein WCM93_09155 [Bacteroidota bacterium]
MNNPNESDKFWIDELAEIIRKKKEENEILKRLGESFSHPGKTLQMNQVDPNESNENNENNK